MTITPPTIRVVTPEAAAYLWRISDARLRRLALDGELPYVTVKWGGRRPSRAYWFDACVERWGEPDPDRLALLAHFELFQMLDTTAIWELYTPRPIVLNGADLAAHVAGQS